MIAVVSVDKARFRFRYYIDLVFFGRTRFYRCASLFVQVHHRIPDRSSVSMSEIIADALFIPLIFNIGLISA